MISLAVLIVSIYLLVKNVDFDTVFYNLSQINGLIFVFTVAISIFRTWLGGLRWELLHPNEDRGMSKWAYFRLSMLSFFFNLFMPGALGGDVIKTAYAINESEGQKIKKVIAILMDRVIGLISILILGMLALLITHEKLPISLWHVVVLFLLSGGFVIFLFSSKVLDFFEKIIGKTPWLSRLISPLLTNWRESVKYYRNNLNSVFYSLALCVPIHLISFIIYYVLAISLGINVGFFEMIFAVAIMWLITAVPISIGGMGIRELSFVWLLGMFSVPPEQAVSLSVLGYVNSLIKSVFALPLLFDFRKNKEGKTW